MVNHSSPPSEKSPKVSTAMPSPSGVDNPFLSTPAHSAAGNLPAMSTPKGDGVGHRPGDRGSVNRLRIIEDSLFSQPLDVIKAQVKQVQNLLKEERQENDDLRRELVQERLARETTQQELEQSLAAREQLRKQLNLEQSARELVQAEIQYRNTISQEEIAKERSSREQAELSAIHERLAKEEVQDQLLRACVSRETAKTLASQDRAALEKVQGHLTRQTALREIAQHGFENERKLREDIEKKYNQLLGVSVSSEDEERPPKITLKLRSSGKAKADDGKSSKTRFLGGSVSSDDTESPAVSSSKLRSSRKPKANGKRLKSNPASSKDVITLDELESDGESGWNFNPWPPTPLPTEMGLSLASDKAHRLPEAQVAPPIQPGQLTPDLRQAKGSMVPKTPSISAPLPSSKRCESVLIISNCSRPQSISARPRNLRALPSAAKSKLSSTAATSTSSAMFPTSINTNVAATGSGSKADPFRLSPGKAKSRESNLVDIDMTTPVADPQTIAQNAEKSTTPKAVGGMGSISTWTPMNPPVGPVIDLSMDVESDGERPLTPSLKRPQAVAITPNSNRRQRHRVDKGLGPLTPGLSLIKFSSNPEVSHSTTATLGNVTTSEASTAQNSSTSSLPTTNEVSDESRYEKLYRELPDDVVNKVMDEVDETQKSKK